MELPPLTVIRALVQRWARLRARLGDEFGDRQLVLPNAEFFPDPFRPDQKGVAKLVNRMRKHAGMNDIPMWTKLVQIEGAVDACGCGTGSCKTNAGRDHDQRGAADSCCGGTSTKTAPEDLVRLVDEGETWRLNVPDIEVTNSVVLTTNIARALGHVFLHETREEGRPIDEPVEVTAELASVALGFGVLLLEGSYIYSKSCGGPRIARATLLGPAELAVVTALFATVGEHHPRAAKKELGTTQRALFSEALSLVASNPELVQYLAKSPGKLVDGKFELVEAQPWLSRVLGTRQARPGPTAGRLGDETGVEELEQMLAVMPEGKPRKKKHQRDPKDDELKALVEEALDEAPAPGSGAGAAPGVRPGA